MFETTRLFFFIFGALTILGGVIGFVKAKSKASLIAGGIAGVLLLGAAWFMAGSPTAAAAVALVVSLLLAGRFLPVFWRTRGFMPAGMMSVLSVIGVVLAVLYFAGVR